MQIRHVVLVSILMVSFSPGASAGIYDDEFDGQKLSDQWYVDMNPLWFWSIPGALDPYATVTLEDGQAVLTSDNDTSAAMILAWGPARLTGSWAVETQMICPPQNDFRSGLSLRLTSPRGLAVLIGIARQSTADAGLVLLQAGPDNKLKVIPWQVPENIATAKKLILRLESMGENLAQVRCGVKLPQSATWTWSQPQKLDLVPDYIGDIQLANFSVPDAPSHSISAAFDYFHVAGDDFRPSPPPMESLELLQRAATMNPFDLETRAELAINAMMGVMDPVRQMPLFLAYLGSPVWLQTPVPVFAGEYTDGLVMARIISGSQKGEKGEVMMRRIIYETMVDGFNWGPKSLGTGIAGHKHILPSLLTLHRLFPEDPRPLKLMRESLQAFHRIALKGKLENGQPYLYFPVADSVTHCGYYSGTGYHRTKGWQGRTKEPIDTGSACFQGVITLPFAHYYELTKDPQADEFLDQFIRFILKRSQDFNPDASFTKDHDVVNGQVWSRLMTIEGILIYALASGRNDLVSWARMAYDQAQKLHGTRFGWLPENLNFNHDLACETDTMTAQIEIAFLLARNVDDYYWEVAERIAMNQILAQQLIRVDFLGGPTPQQAALLQQKPSDPQRQKLPFEPKMTPVGFEGQSLHDFEQIPLRLLGGFASMCSPNDWDSFMSLVPNYITMSSHGSGMRALYNIWYHIAEWDTGHDGPTLRVNLHWSRNLAQAQIISYLPASTQLQIKLRQPGRVMVRKPDWAQGEHIRAEAILPGKNPERQPLDIKIQGRWIHLGHFPQGANIIIHFPDEIVTHRDIIYQRTPGVGYYGPLTSEPQGGTQWTQRVYTTQWRGNAVVDMQPQGKHQPNYDRRKTSDPYIPRHVATLDLDPIAMTPVKNHQYRRNRQKSKTSSQNGSNVQILRGQLAFDAGVNIEKIVSGRQ